MKFIDKKDLNMRYIYLLLLLLYVSTCHGIQCRNENNQPVDWFVMYKLPHIAKNVNNLIKEGLSYIYITSEDISSGWKLSNISINESISMPGYTLAPLYKKKPMYILYNDQPPLKVPNTKHGHTKGVLISDEISGFWLIHSVPHFPPETSYSYPNTGLKFGQSFLCISLNLSNINNVGKQLQYNDPHIYQYQMSDILKGKLPEINAIINHETVKIAPWFRLQNLQTLNGNEFISFAKYKMFNKDLYGDWVATVLKNDIFVESWLNGKGKLPSNCTNKYRVNNILSIRIPFNNASFSSNDDHSKWAITASNSSTMNWICIGDINREEPQEHRGGGTVCFSNKNVWSQYYSIINDIEKCNNTKKIK